MDLTQDSSFHQLFFFLKVVVSVFLWLTILSQNFYCCDKTVTISNWVGKVYFILQFEVHHPGKSGQERMQGLGVLLVGLLPVTQSAYFI